MVVGVVIAAILAPAFVRYRVSRLDTDEPDVISEHTPDDDKV